MKSKTRAAPAGRPQINAINGLGDVMAESNIDQAAEDAWGDPEAIYSLIAKLDARTFSPAYDYEDVEPTTDQIQEMIFGQLNDLDPQISPSQEQLTSLVRFVHPLAHFQAQFSPDNSPDFGMAERFTAATLRKWQQDHLKYDIIQRPIMERNESPPPVEAWIEEYESTDASIDDMLAQPTSAVLQSVLDGLSQRQQLIDRLNTESQELVDQARELGASWSKIAARTNMSRSGAYKKWDSEGREKNRENQRSYLDRLKSQSDESDS